MRHLIEMMLHTLSTEFESGELSDQYSNEISTFEKTALSLKYGKMRGFARKQPFFPNILFISGTGFW